MKILVIDVGGNNVKVSISARKGEPLKVPSGPEMTAAKMAAAVKKATAGWVYQAVSIGYPGPVVDGKPTRDPANLAAGWKGFDYRKAFGRRVRLVNDAAMQALGSYTGGRMLFLGLGTGLGSALVIEGVLAPMELAHLPYKKGKTYEDYVGERGLKRLGRKKWTEAVHDVVAQLKRPAMRLQLGGGQTKRLKKLPRGVRLGNNAHAILGGVRLWDDKNERRKGPAATAGEGHGTCAGEGGPATPAAESVIAEVNGEPRYPASRAPPARFHVATRRCSCGTRSRSPPRTASRVPWGGPFRRGRRQARRLGERLADDGHAVSAARFRARWRLRSVWRGPTANTFIATVCARSATAAGV
jgi:hypothetical protein